MKRIHTPLTHSSHTSLMLSDHRLCFDKTNLTSMTTYKRFPLEALEKAGKETLTLLGFFFVKIQFEE